MRRWWRRRIRRRGYGTISFKIPPYKRRKFASLIVLGSFFISLWFTFWLVDVRLRPSLRALAQAKAKVMAIAAISNALAGGAAPAVNYQDLVTIQRDEQGRPVLLQPNTGALNRLAARITLDVQHALVNLRRMRVRLPLGQVLGTRILGSWGPQVSTTLWPVGTVESRIIDSFSAAGINQTRHRISLRLTTEVKIAVPLVSASAEIVTDVPLTEAIIVGEVPRVYLGGIVQQR